MNGSADQLIDSLIDRIEARHAELETEMSDPEVIADRTRYAELGREYGRIDRARALALEYRKVSDDLAGARELLEEGDGDEEIQKVSREAPAELDRLAEEIRLVQLT